MSKVRKPKQFRGRVSGTTKKVKEKVVFEYLKGDDKVVEVKTFRFGSLLNRVSVLALSKEDFEKLNAPPAEGGE